MFWTNACQTPNTLDPISNSSHSLHGFGLWLRDDVSPPAAWDLCRGSSLQWGLSTLHFACTSKATIFIAISCKKFRKGLKTKESNRPGLCFHKGFWLLKGHKYFWRIKWGASYRCSQNPGAQKKRERERGNKSYSEGYSPFPHLYMHNLQRFPWRWIGWIYGKM